MTDLTARHTDRRGFLGAAAGAAALGLGGLVPATLAAEAAKTADGDAQFMAWLDGIKGKYKQVYDVSEANDGFGLVWAWVFLWTGPAAYGVAESDLCAVIVARHGGVPLVMNDSVWAKYKLGEQYHINDPATGAPAVRNIYANRKADDPFVEASAEKLVPRGIRIGACNVAITFGSQMAAKKLGMDAAVAKQDWLAGLLPGVAVVPSGVVAINGAQSRGCSYVYAGG